LISKSYSENAWRQASARLSLFYTLRTSGAMGAAIRAVIIFDQGGESDMTDEEQKILECVWEKAKESGMLVTNGHEPMIRATREWLMATYDRCRKELAASNP
jgi:hypothetical protein